VNVQDLAECFHPKFSIENLENTGFYDSYGFTIGVEDCICENGDKNFEVPVYFLALIPRMTVNDKLKLENPGNNTSIWSLLGFTYNQFKLISHTFIK
jgi:hypothetical protein